MGREHVVIGGDNGEIGTIACPQCGLVTRSTGRKAVSLVRATEPLAARAGGGRSGDAVQIARASVMRALGNFGDTGIHTGRWNKIGHSNLLTGYAGYATMCVIIDAEAMKSASASACAALS